MASSMEAQERAKLYKFTKILALKVAQVVVQSRQGKKITQQCNDIKPVDNGLSSSPTNLQWVCLLTFYINRYKLLCNIFIFKHSCCHLVLNA